MTTKPIYVPYLKSGYYVFSQKRKGEECWVVAKWNGKKFTAGTNMGACMRGRNPLGRAENEAYARNRKRNFDIGQYDVHLSNRRVAELQGTEPDAFAQCLEAIVLFLDRKFEAGLKTIAEVDGCFMHNFILETLVSYIQFKKPIRDPNAPVDEWFNRQEETDPAVIDTVLEEIIMSCVMEVFFHEHMKMIYIGGANARYGLFFFENMEEFIQPLPKEEDKKLKHINDFIDIVNNPRHSIYNHLILRPINSPDILKPLMEKARGLRVGFPYDEYKYKP